MHPASRSVAWFVALSLAVVGACAVATPVPGLVAKATVDGSPESALIVVRPAAQRLWLCGQSFLCGVTVYTPGEPMDVRFTNLAGTDYVVVDIPSAVVLAMGFRTVPARALPNVRGDWLLGDDAATFFPGITPATPMLRPNGNYYTLMVPAHGLPKGLSLWLQAVIRTPTGSAVTSLVHFVT